MATFRSGPRDPVTGQSSAVISSGNTVRADGQTDNERSQTASQYTADPGQEQEYQQAEQNYRDFLKETGRSDTNPYGNDGIVSRLTGVSPDKVNYTSNIGAAGIESLNRLAYDQFLNPLDSQGRVRGMLREGSPTRYGDVVRDPTRRRDLGVFSVIPGLGMISSMMGGRSELAVPAGPPRPGPFTTPFNSPLDTPSLSPTPSGLMGGDSDDSDRDLLDLTPPAPDPIEEKVEPEKKEAENLNPFFIAPLQDPDPVEAADPVSYIFDQFGNVVLGERQGPPELRMDKILTPGFTTIQGILDFPGTEQDRTFRATSTGTGTEPLTADDLLNSYLERSPLYR